MSGWRTILVGLCLMLVSCQRNELCYDHPNGSLHVLMDWSALQPDLGKPEGVRISFYDSAQGKEKGTVYLSTNGGSVAIEDGEHYMLVVNSDTEMISFRDMDRFDLAHAYLDTRTRQPYRNSPAAKAPTTNGIYYSPSSQANVRTQRENTVGQPDRFFVTHSSLRTMAHNTTQSHDTIWAMPESRVATATIAVRVKGARNVKECRASLSGAARSLNLATGKPNAETGTVIFNMSRGGDSFSQTVSTFGLMRSPPETPPDEAIQNLITLEFLLLDNSVKLFEYDVQDQIGQDPENPNLELPLELEDIEIPDVEPSDGGFDAGIGDWDEEIAIPI